MVPYTGEESVFQVRKERESESNTGGELAEEDIDDGQSQCDISGEEEQIAEYLNFISDVGAPVWYDESLSKKRSRDADVDRKNVETLRALKRQREEGELEEELDEGVQSRSSSDAGRHVTPEMVSTSDFKDGSGQDQVMHDADGCEDDNAYQSGVDDMELESQDGDEDGEEKSVGGQNDDEEMGVL